MGHDRADLIDYRDQDFVACVGIAAVLLIAISNLNDRKKKARRDKKAQIIESLKKLEEAISNDWYRMSRVKGEAFLGDCCYFSVEPREEDFEVLVGKDCPRTVPVKERLEASVKKHWVDITGDGRYRRWQVMGNFKLTVGNLKDASGELRGFETGLIFVDRPE